MDWNIRGNPRVVASGRSGRFPDASPAHLPHRNLATNGLAHPRKSARSCLDDSKENSPDITPANLPRRNFASRGMEWRGVAQPLQGAPISVHFAPVDFVGSTHPLLLTHGLLRDPTQSELPGPRSTPFSIIAVPRSQHFAPRARTKLKRLRENHPQRDPNFN